ncbi:phenylalanine 4-monooxygenase [Marinomonas sp. 2405UD68-3]|uniref:phenylalanine 4-monooxygenase n=1 Tax=Marinomonas sp. 2405UD68-3 TaxID=3391835 RepID=UPI0039C93F40
MKGHTYVSRPVDDNGYVQWSDEENKTWSVLVERQSNVIKGKACDAFYEGLALLNFPTDRIPQIPDINRILNSITGWGVEPVPAIIQPKEFFTLLANKRFPAATFIRVPEEIDYIQEPDIFHEVYGHTPLLTNQSYADFMEKFGTLALQADPKDRARLFRLFWFTIEFGLLTTPDGLRAYGGGILSSIGETQFCVSGEPVVQPFDVLTVLRTPYRIDIIQPLYFAINDFSDLFSILEQDILGLLERSKTLGNNEPLYPPADKKAS